MGPSVLSVPRSEAQYSIFEEREEQRGYKLHCAPASFLVLMLTFILSCLSPVLYARDEIFNQNSAADATA